MRKGMLSECDGLALVAARGSTRAHQAAETTHELPAARQDWPCLD
eukprot:CAMPEP_0185524832 /NCGR_PEP_ID=MMETSP1366-20130426/89180_1 /TAXON_ID=38817 /ORGANISM="Gephyrocapsa oceanica, Strain RCC1303" /LENGTH=44 /DNA_ID= /DNA_START= /DNA_END= /DNA_ORIENTATION=